MRIATDGSIPNRDVCILVIDDDDSVRSFMIRILERAGFKVLAARDGVEGLALLRAAANIRLVLLDLMMPRMNGREFRQHQLAEPGIAAIPTVVVSGSALGEDEFAEMKAAEIIHKPVRAAHLLRIATRHAVTGAPPLM